MNLPFVEGWRQSWRWLSMHLAVIASGFAGVFVADPWSAASVLFAVVGHMPDSLRLVCAIAVAVAVFGVIAFARLYKQAPK